MSARQMAEAVGSRFSRDKGQRTSPHGDMMDAPTTVTEAEEQGVLGMSRETRDRLDGADDPYAGPPPRDLTKVLGKAVHPRALNRLVELWPEAVVAVEHFDGEGFNSVPLKATRVLIRRAAEDSGTAVYADALCRLDTDTWDRHFGIRLAFNRALKAVKAAEDLRVMGGAAPTAEAPRA